MENSGILRNCGSRFPRVLLFVFVKCVMRASASVCKDRDENERKKISERGEK